MKALFGSAVNSLSSVQYAIEKKLGEKTTSLLVKGKKYSNKKILLIPNVNALRSNIKALEKWNGVAIVFDSPTNLCSIEKLQWLDVKRQHDILSYRFSFIEPNYDRVFTAYEEKIKKPIKLKKTDILRSLIINKSDTPFLEKWNNFLYFCTSHTNREYCKKLLIDYFNNSLTIEKFNQFLSARLRADQVEYYKKEILNWLKSEEGLQLKNAWVNLKKDDAIKVAKKYNVNIQDLRYITRVIKLHKEIVKFAENKEVTK